MPYIVKLLSMESMHLFEFLALLQLSISAICYFQELLLIMFIFYLLRGMSWSLHAGSLEIHSDLTLASISENCGVEQL